MSQKQKRKSKVKKVRAAKKKASVVRRLKVKSRAKSHTSRKPLRGKLPASARKHVVAKAAQAKAPVAPPAEKSGKKAKTPSAKQALILG